MTMTIPYPSEQAISPAMRKLDAHPGSVILVAVQRDEFGHLDVSHGWFTADERKALKLALTKARKARVKAKA